MPVKMQTDEPVSTPPGWDERAYAVALTRGVHVDGEHIGREPGETYKLQPGDEYPLDLVTPERWEVWQCAKLAILDEEFSRIDSPSTSERLSDEINANAVLDDFRRGHGVRFERVVERVFTCDDCGKEFDELSQLHGHQGAHADRPADADEDAADGPQADADDDATDDPDRDADADEAAESGPTTHTMGDVLAGEG